MLGTNKKKKAMKPGRIVKVVDLTDVAYGKTGIIKKMDGALVTVQLLGHTRKIRARHLKVVK